MFVAFIIKNNFDKLVNKKKPLCGLCGAVWKRTTQNEKRTHNTKHTNKVQTLCGVRFRFFQTRRINFGYFIFAQ
jgi:hypothetical protein